MKKIILMLLIFSCCVLSVAVDAHRDIFYQIDENLNVKTQYVDYLYGDAQATLAYIQSFPTEAEYISTRVAPDFKLENFKVEANAELVKLTINGQYNSYVKREKELIKIGGKGFVDRTCKDYPYEILNPVKQSFHIEIKIPETWTVFEAPAPSSADNLLKFEYKTAVANHTLYEDVYFELKNQTSVSFYCGEREQINKALTIGFTASENRNDWLGIVVILITTILMIIIVRILK